MKAKSKGRRGPFFLRKIRSPIGLAAIALAGAVTSGSASAQVTDGVTLSGSVDNGFGYYHSGGKTTWAATNGAFAASSFAMTGSENLGDGYSSFFVLRSLFNSDTGVLVSGLAYASEAKVGLRTPYGQLQAGRLFSLNDLFFLWNSPSSSNYAGAWNMALNGYSAYWDNSIRYTSPQWNGLTGIIQHSFDIVGDQTPANPHEGVGTEYAVNYANGPVQLESVYEEAFKEALPATNYKARRISVGGIYDFHYAKVHLAYYREVYSGPGQPIPFDIKFAGVTVPISPFWRATAEYGYRHYLAGSNSHTQFTGLGLFYLLSKSTSIYAEAAIVQNHGLASAYSIYHGPTVGPGINTSGVTLELRHNF